MKYDCLISNVECKTKDSAAEHAGEFKKAVMEKRALFKSYGFPFFKRMITSRIFNLGALSHPRIFGVDIDNGNKNKAFTYEDICAYLITFYVAPIIVSETFSSTEAHPRYRFIFCLDEESENKKEYETAVEKVIELINGHFGSKVADASCNKTTTIFYPSTNIVYSNPDNIVSKSRLLSYRRTNLIPLYFKKFAYELHRRMNLISDYKYRARTERENFARSICVPFSNYHRAHVGLPSLIYTDNDILFIVAEKSIEYLRNNGVWRNNLSEFTGAGLKKPAVDAPKRVFGSLKEQLECTPLSSLLNQKENVLFTDIFGDKDSKGEPLQAMCYRSPITGKSYYAVYEYGDKKEKHRYDIFSLIGRIYNQNGLKENLDFIAHECGIAINPIPPKDMVKNIDNCLKNLDKYLNKYANLAGLLGDTHKVKPLFIEILEKAKKMYNNLAINADTDGDQILLASSLFKETRKGTVNFAFRLLNRLGLLHVLKPNEYNGWVRSQMVIYNKRSSVKDYRFVTFPKFTDDLFRIADELAAKTAEFGIDIYRAQSCNSEEDIFKIDQVLKRYADFWKEEHCEYMPLNEAKKILGSNFDRMHYALLEKGHFEEFSLRLRFANRYGLRGKMAEKNWPEKTILLRQKYKL